MITEKDEIIVENVEVISGRKLFENPDYRKDNYKIYLKGFEEYFVDAVSDEIKWEKLIGYKIRGLREYKSVGKKWLGCEKTSKIEIIMYYNDLVK